VSNVEFFRCSEKYFDDYSQYKKDMENIYSIISAKTILKELSNGEMGQNTDAGKGSDKSITDKVSDQSFLVTFSNLMLFVTFLYQPFLANPDQ
jgi:hypothetical protein